MQKILSKQSIYLYLSKNYKIKSDKEMSIELKLSRSRVNKYLHIFNLIRTKEELLKIDSTYTWSNEDLSFLKKNYLKLSYNEIGKKLGKTKSSVSSKVNKLGLKKMKGDFLNDNIIENEKWKKLKKFEGYSVSNLGRVKNDLNDRILKQSESKGYFTVNLHNKTTRVHKLVALKFVRKKLSDEKLVVNHIDGNKLNNQSTNLEWVTNNENIQHAMKNGLMNCSFIILNEEQVKKICSYFSKGYGIDKTYQAMNKKINPSTLADIKRRKTWKSISNQYDW